MSQTNQWKIGDVKITRVQESQTLWDGTMLLPNATAENVVKEDWLFPNFTTEDGKLKLSIHALVIESKGRKIIVDTCVGNDKKRPAFPDWTNQKLPFLDTLKNAGYPRESIDRVVCTHLHLDHVGWNTMKVNDRWVPTFANAKYILGGTEWDFFSSQEDPFFKDPIEDSVRPAMDHGLTELIDANHELTDEVSFESTPGHTPGHMSIRISSNGTNAVITGDMMHHPIQCRYPEWDDNFDTDGPMAKKTRRGFCERYADTGTLVFGTHFAAPVGKITRSGDSFRFTAI